MLKQIQLFEMYWNSRECAETADKCADLNKRMLNSRKCAETDLNCFMKQQRMCWHSRKLLNVVWNGLHSRECAVTADECVDMNKKC